MGNMFGRGFESHQLHLVMYKSKFPAKNRKLFLCCERTYFVHQTLLPF